MHVLVLVGLPQKAKKLPVSLKRIIQTDTSPSDFEEVITHAQDEEGDVTGGKFGVRSVLYKCIFASVPESGMVSLVDSGMGATFDMEANGDNMLEYYNQFIGTVFDENTQYESIAEFETFYGQVS